MIKSLVYTFNFDFIHINAAVLSILTAYAKFHTSPIIYVPNQFPQFSDQFTIAIYYRSIPHQLSNPLHLTAAPHILARGRHASTLVPEHTL